MRHRIFYKSIFTILAYLGCTLALQAQTGVSLERVTQNVSTLSSDEMAGRAPGTEGSQKAISFISSAYQKAGLVPMQGMEDFKQAFSLEKVITDKAYIKLNKSVITSENFFIVGGKEALKTRKAADLNIVYLSADQDFSEQWHALRDSNSPLLVVAAPEHEDIYRQYWEVLKKPSPTEAVDDNQLAIWVLSAEAPVKKVKLDIKQHTEEVKMHNVVGMIPGRSRKQEFVLFSAHFDHIGIINSVQGDSIANGADDNASGVATILEIAHYFKRTGSERTLVFAAFDGEEIGLKGSKFFATQVDPAQYVAQLNFDMMGKISDRGVRKAYITGFRESSLPATMQKTAATKGYRFFADPYTDMNLFLRSDNAPLAIRGVAAHTISSTPIDFDPYYHTVNDEIQTLDLDNLTELIKGIIIGIKPITSGQVTPSRSN